MMNDFVRSYIKFKIKRLSELASFFFNGYNEELINKWLNSYLHKIGNETITSVNGFNYVSGYKFKVPATSSEKIIFYKADRTKDYTYPIVNSSSIVNVSVQTAK